MVRSWTASSLKLPESHDVPSKTTADYALPEFRNVDRVTLNPRLRSRWQSEVEALRNEFVRQNRRLGTPLSQDEIRNPAIARVVDQIRILLRLIDVELLNYHIADQPVLCPASIRSLLELNARWIDRLENQVWLLEESIEHAQELNQVLTGLFAGHGSAFDALDDFAKRFADSASEVPTSSLLIPEPGLLLSHELTGHVETGAAEMIAGALQSTRLLAWAQKRNHRLTPERRTAILYSLLQDAGLFAIDRRFRKSSSARAMHRQAKELIASVVGDWPGAPKGLTTLMGGDQSAFSKVAGSVDATARLVFLMEAQSSELAKKNVLANVETAFSPAVRQLIAESKNGQFDQKQVETLLQALDLSPAVHKTGFAERLLLFKRLRRHAAAQPESKVPQPNFLKRKSKLSIQVPDNGEKKAV